MSGAAQDVLSLAGAPLALPAVAERIVASRTGWTPSRAVLAVIEGSAGRALRHQRSLGAARNPAKQARSVLRELAEGVAPGG